MLTVDLPGTENLYAYQVTIASGTNLSEVIATQGKALVGILMPAAWDAASLRYNAGLASNALSPAYDSAGNAEVTTVAASHFVAIPTSDAIFAPFLQLASVDGTGAAVNQTAARTLTLLFRRFLS